MNDPEAELWDIAWSVVPDVVVAGGGAIKKKIGTGIAEAAGKVEIPVAHWTDLGEVVDDVLDDVKVSHTNGNLLEVGDLAGNSGKVYRVVPENMDGAVTGKPTTASPNGVAGVWENVDSPRGSAGEPAKAVVGGEAYGWDVPDVGSRSGNPGRSYGDMNGASNGKVTTEPSSTTSLSKGVDGSQTPKKAGGELYGGDGVYIPKDTDGNPIPLKKQTVNGQDIPLPDPAAEGRSHTVLGGKVSSGTGEVYRQSATFPDGTWPAVNGHDVPWSEVHWTDHGTPQHHKNPHQHIFEYNSDKGGWIRKGPTEFEP